MQPHLPLLTLNPGIINGLKRAAHYLFFGNIFIALCAVSLVGASEIILRHSLPGSLYVFIFFATAFLYTFDSVSPRKFTQNSTKSIRKEWVRRHKTLLYYWMFFSGFATIYFFITLGFTLNLFFIGHLFLISVLYSLPVYPTATGWQPLRHIPLLKIFLIGYVWSCVTVWLPVLSIHQELSSGINYLLFAQRFLYILALTILFDIRDIHHDQKNKTLTVPGLAGIRNAKYIAWLLLLGFSLLVIITPEIKADKIALLISGAISGVVIWLGNEKRSEYFYALAADGMMILQFLLLLSVQKSLS